MTVIVALEHEGSVYMGADSAGVETATFDLCCRADEKVFITHDSDFIMGFCGSFRIGQLLRYALIPPDQPGKKDDMAYMVTDFIDAVRMMQKEKGTITKEDDREEQANSGFIVGYKGKIYVVECDFQVGRPISNFAAVGCGAPYALGAMYATRNDKKMSPRERINLALEAAEAHSAGVRRPFHVLELSSGED